METLIHKDKVALITGSSSGIGAATAKKLAAEGALVAVVASSVAAKAEAVVGEIRAAGGVAIAFTADVSEPLEVRNLVNNVERDLGPIDILVNCAGVFYSTVIGETTELEFQKMIAINLKGTYFAIDAVVSGMKARNFGKIVNISSAAGFKAVENYGLYCAVKAAIINLTRSLARDLAPFGINVNALAPGNTATPMNEELRTDPKFATYIEAIHKKTPSLRKFTPPEEMAETISFIVSDAAAAMYGTTILMDEGAGT